MALGGIVFMMAIVLSYKWSEGTYRVRSDQGSEKSRSKCGVKGVNLFPFDDYALLLHPIRRTIECLMIYSTAIFQKP